jgi:hypothetical protein
MDFAFLCRGLAAWTTMEAISVWFWSTLSDSGREVCVGFGEHNGWAISTRCSILWRNCPRMVTCLPCSQRWKINTKWACTTLQYCCLYGPLSSLPQPSLLFPSTLLVSLSEQFILSFDTAGSSSLGSLHCYMSHLWIQWFQCLVEILLYCSICWGSEFWTVDHPSCDNGDFMDMFHGLFRMPLWAMDCVPINGIHVHNTELGALIFTLRNLAIMYVEFIPHWISPCVMYR